MHQRPTSVFWKKLPFPIFAFCLLLLYYFFSIYSRISHIWRQFLASGIYLAFILFGRRLCFATVFGFWLFINIIIAKWNWKHTKIAKIAPSILYFIFSCLFLSVFLALDLDLDLLLLGPPTYLYFQHILFYSFFL